MTPESDRLAAILGAAMLEAIDRSVAARLPELLTKTGPEGFISTVRAAALAGVKPDTILSWISRGVLPAQRPPGVRNWKIRPADLERAMSSTGQDSVRQPVDLARRLAERVVKP